MRKVNYFQKDFTLITEHGLRRFYLKKVANGFQLVEFNFGDLMITHVNISQLKKTKGFAMATILGDSVSKYLRNGRVFDSQELADKFLHKYIHHSK